MRKTELILIGMFLIAFSSNATVYNCSTTEEIHNAMAAAQAGDEIVIASGSYVSSASINAAYFYGGANGTASNPITIRGASASDRAHLKGNSISSKTILRIEGDYWIVKDLELSYGQKALVFDNSNYSKAINCVVHNTGNEGIHVRDGSDHVTIDGCTVYNTGNVNAGFGEGIYIGTDKGSWSSYNPYCDYTLVKNCTIGPNVRAEAFDIKEGTQETTIEYNTVDGLGISGSNYADSFIDLKGVRTYVRYNTFYRNGESNITKGIAAIDRSVELSSYEHAVHDNSFHMDGSSYNIVEAYSGTSDVHAWDNTRSPSGDMYNSRVTQSCPSWYNLCGGTGNESPTVSITSPSDGSTYTEGDNVAIEASASDSDGSVTSVKFYHGPNLIGEDTSSPYSVTWSNVPAGTYNLTAVATDNENATTTSPTVSITVNSQDGGGGGGTSGDLSLQYECGDTEATNNKIKPYLVIVNDGSSNVAYSDLTIRYWFTKEGSASPTFTCDYAALGKSHVNGSFVNTGGSNYYLETSFDASAGNLSGNGNSGTIKLRINKSDWSNFDENDDYSFNASISSFQSYDKITLYRNGALVWGIEPASGSRSTSDLNAHAISETAVSIYPNPASEFIHITLGKEWSGSQVRIFSISGVETSVNMKAQDEDNLTIDLSGVKSGFYLVTLNKDGKKKSHRIFVR